MSRYIRGWGVISHIHQRVLGWHAETMHLVVQTPQISRAMILGDDWCVVCCVNLADTLLQCPFHHRIYCSSCFEKLVERVWHQNSEAKRRWLVGEVQTLNFAKLKCAYCMKELKGGLFSQPIPCQLQLEATRIRDAYADDLHGYPWQVLVDGYGQGRADLDTLRTVREAMRKNGTTSVSTLREEASTWKFAMQEDLSEIQLEYVPQLWFVEDFVSAWWHEI